MANIIENRHRAAGPSLLHRYSQPWKWRSHRCHLESLDRSRCFWACPVTTPSPPCLPARARTLVPETSPQLLASSNFHVDLLHYRPAANLVEFKTQLESLRGGHDPDTLRSRAL